MVESIQGLCVDFLGQPVAQPIKNGCRNQSSGLLFSQKKLKLGKETRARLKEMVLKESGRTN